LTLDEDLLARARRVRLVLLDVDGVLTDGVLGYGSSGDEGRSFFVRDGSAIKLLQAEGVPVGLITGRTTAATALRAEELALEEVHQGRRLKEPCFDEILARRGLADEEVAFMGDDWLDLPLLRRAGLAAAPSDASAEARAAAHFVAASPGGRGAVRDLAELVLRSRGAWEAAIARALAP
jgi:3-deoxy-D-manno-octulosonate 8-phosphate phosphatase (KDO 8-P phosphatase)